MGSEVSLETETKHGLQKSFQGDHIVVRPLADHQGNLMHPADTALIFLPDNGRSSQDYLELFFCFHTARAIVPFDAYCKVTILQPPHTVKEHQKKGHVVKRDGNWNYADEAIEKSAGYELVMARIAAEVEEIRGQARKVFLVGHGAGGVLAAHCAFNSPYQLGGVFVLDAEFPS